MESGPFGRYRSAMTVGKIVGIFSRADNIQRVVIVEREDGLFTFQLQWAVRGGGWGLRGLDCGIYDSPETAASEAQQRVWWLRAMAEPEE